MMKKGVFGVFLFLPFLAFAQQRLTDKLTEMIDKYEYKEVGRIVEIKSFEIDDSVRIGSPAYGIGINHRNKALAESLLLDSINLNKLNEKSSTSLF